MSLPAAILALDLFGSPVAAVPSADRQPALPPGVLDDFRRASQLKPEFASHYEEALARQYSPPAPRRGAGDEWIVSLVGGTWLLFAMLWPAPERKSRSPTRAA